MAKDMASGCAPRDRSDGGGFRSRVSRRGLFGLLAAAPLAAVGQATVPAKVMVARDFEASALLNRFAGTPATIMLDETDSSALALWDRLKAAADVRAAADEAARDRKEWTELLAEHGRRYEDVVPAPVGCPQIDPFAIGRSSDAEYIWRDGTGRVIVRCPVRCEPPVVDALGRCSPPRLPVALQEGDTSDVARMVSDAVASDRDDAVEHVGVDDPLFPELGHQAKDHCQRELAGVGDVAVVHSSLRRLCGNADGEGRPALWARSAVPVLLGEML